MLHKEFFGLIFLGFVFWIIVATTPNQRIENACRPVGWTGNIVTSLSALALPSQQGSVQGWFDKAEYGCRYTTWRLFYQDAYNQWKNSVAGSVAVPPATAAVPSASATVTTAPAASAPSQSASSPVPANATTY